MNTDTTDPRFRFGSPRHRALVRERQRKQQQKETIKSFIGFVLLIAMLITATYILFSL